MLLRALLGRRLGRVAALNIPGIGVYVPVTGVRPRVHPKESCGAPDREPSRSPAQCSGGEGGRASWILLAVHSCYASNLLQRGERIDQKRVTVRILKPGGIS